MDQLQDNSSTKFLLTKGTRLAERYLIQNPLHQALNSAVYQARDLRFPNVDKRVTVEEYFNPAPEPAARQENLKNFERQVNLLATLSHPAVPVILDYFLQDRHAYLVREFIDGQTLASLQEAPPGFLPPDQVLPWAIALCEALQYFHEHEPEPIHLRVLNPRGIMLDSHNQVKLVDFGLQASFHHPADANYPGSISYLAPEIADQQNNTPADIYILGAFLYRLLQGRMPDQQELVVGVQETTLQWNPQVPEELQTILSKALQHDPAARYQSAAEMKSDLLTVLGRSDSRQLAPQFSQVAPIEQSKIKSLWTFTSADEIRGTALYHRGVVYFGSYDQHLYALKADSGNLLWKYKTDGGIVSRPAVEGDSVFIGSEDNRLHVVSARNGGLAWTYYTKGPIRSSPFVAHGHVFIGSDDMSLHAVNIKGGRGIWQIDTIGEVRSTPFVTQEEVYTGNEAGEFYCTDFRGNIKWRFKAKRAITSSAFMANNTVYFSSLDGYIYALEAKTGYLLWRFKMGKGSISSPCLADNLLYTGAIDGNIYCVNKNTAKEVWRFQTADQVTGSPIVVDEDLYCGSVDGNLYCLDRQTGKLRWKFNTHKPITGTPATGDGVVYIGSTDNQIYAIPAKPGS